MSYHCTKRFSEICVAHRHWKAGTHCAYIHGYARTVELTLACTALDSRGWVFDLGGFKQMRDWLNEQWDHRVLVNDDDPLLEEFRKLERQGALSLNVMTTGKGWHSGLEGSCKHLYDNLNPMVKSLSQDRCRIVKVEIWEKTDNRASLEMP